MSEQSLNFYKHGNEKAPKSLVILLHGYGSNGQDLISLAPEWAGDMPDTLFISPDAPFPCEMGGFGFQWFSLVFICFQLSIKKPSLNVLKVFLVYSFVVCFVVLF